MLIFSTLDFLNGEGPLPKIGSYENETVIVGNPDD